MLTYNLPFRSLLNFNDLEELGEEITMCAYFQKELWLCMLNQENIM